MADVEAVGQVRVRVDKPRQHRHIAQVNHPRRCTRLRLQGRRRSHGFDVLTLDKDRLIGLQLAGAYVQQPSGL